MATIDPRIVGTWRMKSTMGRDDAGKLLPPPYGPVAMGLVVFQADGRMMAVLCDGRPSLPEGAKREYSSYCGNYTFDGSTLTTVVDANSDPARFTAPQVRKVRFEGDRMILVPPQVEVNGVKVTRELAWEKISPVSL
jgi:lipocalin-like protein